MRKPNKLDLRKTLFILPNMITLSSVFCGFDSLRISASAQGEEDFYKAALLIVFAMLFDMLDGRVARMTKTQSAFGLQIDSLADVVSFGAAPALLVYEWTLKRLELAYWYTLEFGVVEEDGKLKTYGAGLLSSIGELGSFETHAELKPLDLEEASRLPYDPTTYQKVLYVAPSFDAMVEAVSSWLRSF